MPLKRYWEKEKDRSFRGEYWMGATYTSNPNRAYITFAAKSGERSLFVWDDATGEWDYFVSDTNVRTLKTIGRLEAARRLHV